ncbi:uncharacterized protein AKAW2_30059S [Aspergillus luchuensis]|uniref:Uncharacterized protein n=1 Tax=Aspergillus kawachii TaxID=1069201 RepID=A0A7R7ZW56_ASPKA|nr:uncharacterized protein AKAW2_30059S [Aspergillus luchuensis]BCR96740.1 hypothetical protein AKAW2_30059S [Aspergillus luchuensis]BCS09235.1 hypothetical protein ALUC_30052S [Aspergillus luchuensis]
MKTVLLALPPQPTGKENQLQMWRSTQHASMVRSAITVAPRIMFRLVTGKAQLPFAVAIPAQREKSKSQPINLPRAIAVGSTISPYAVLRRHPMQQLDCANGQALHHTVQVVTIMPVVLRVILST